MELIYKNNRMKKLLTILVFVFLASAGYSQLLAPNGIKYKGTLLTPTAAQFNYVYGVTSAIQTQFTGKVSATDTATMLTKYARKLSPTFTGTVGLPSTTSIGTVSSTEIGYVDGVTSAIQTQLDAKIKLLPDTVNKAASFTVSITEVNKDVHCWKATSIIITIPQNLSDWTVGGYINFEGWGAGIMVFKKGTNVVFISDKDSIASSRKGQIVTVKKLATNKYALFGQLTD
jgi:hypothetical protein